jgi:hypothetical protein
LASALRLNSRKYCGYYFGSSTGIAGGAVEDHIRPL